MVTTMFHVCSKFRRNTVITKVLAPCASALYRGLVRHPGRGVVKAKGSVVVGSAGVCESCLCLPCVCGSRLWARGGAGGGVQALY